MLRLQIKRWGHRESRNGGGVHSEMRRKITLFFLLQLKGLRDPPSLAFCSILLATGNSYPFLSCFTTNWFDGTTWRMIHFCMCFDFQRVVSWGEGGIKGWRVQISFFAVVMARAIKEKSSTLAYLKWKPNVKWMISCAKIHLAIKSVH